MQENKITYGICKKKGCTCSSRQTGSETYLPEEGYCSKEAKASAEGKKVAAVAPTPGPEVHYA